MKRFISYFFTLALTYFLLPQLAIGATTIDIDKADNSFMLICSALVFFMTIPGIALFYGGLLRSKNVLSLMTQVMLIFLSLIHISEPTRP